MCVSGLTATIFSQFQLLWALHRTCVLCVRTKEPPIKSAHGAVCLRISVHTMGATNGVCVHACFLLFRHMDEGGFAGGLCLD